MTEPLTHARIGYDSITKRGTVVASAELAGAPAVAAANALTYSFWSAGLPSTWAIELAEPEACNYFGLAAHDLWDNHVVAVMQAWIDGAWQTMPVLTRCGDIWPFDGDLFGKRGAAPAGTVGSLARGLGNDGNPVAVAFDSTPLAAFGNHSLTVEAAATNLLPENVRTGTDTDGDMTDFTAGGDGTSSELRSCSGKRSVLATFAGSDALVKSDWITCSSETDYAGQVKVYSEDEITVDVILETETGDIVVTNFDNVPGAWTVMRVAAETGVGDVTLRLGISADATCFVDEWQIEEAAAATSWVDGARAAGDLAYPAEVLEAYDGPITLNMWVKGPGATYGTARTFVNVSTTADSSNQLKIARAASSATLNVITQDSDGNSDTMAIAPVSSIWNGPFHMVTVVLDPDAAAGTHNKLVYVDGVLVDSKETSALPTWRLIDGLTVGHAGAGAERIGATWGTWMDDLSVVNYAATAAQVGGWYSAAMTEQTALLPDHADNRPIMMLVEELTSTKFRLKFAGESTPTIGVVYMGKALEMQRALYGGHTPINLARSTMVRPNLSERGQFLGRSIVRTGASGAWTWGNLKAEWVRAHLDPFVEAARTDPFFILWRPDSFPGEAGYCWTLGDPAPSNSGVRDLMTFSLEAEGLGHE